MNEIFFSTFDNLFQESNTIEGMIYLKIEIYVRDIYKR